jgi:hypothetical protein
MPSRRLAENSRRFSGCGSSPIAVHWHFLAAASANIEAMSPMAQSVWSKFFGNAEIRPYDPRGEAAYYVSKLAAHQNGLIVASKLDRMEYHGPSDLVAAAAVNPYVPAHLKDRVFGQYLVVR